MRQIAGGDGKAVVTTTLNVGSSQLELARWFSLELGAPLVARGWNSLATLAREHNVQGVVVVGRDKVSYYSGSQEFFFHPGMAVVRIREIVSGKTDQMIKSLDLGPGDTVLDCTLGLGTDAIVASFMVGQKGRVVGLEYVPVVASLVKHGLAHYHGINPDIVEAMRRVEVYRENHTVYLSRTSPGSFDVVYFDPMFRRALHRANSMNALRPLAAAGALNRAAVELACRAARRRVVIKESRGSKEFQRLGCSQVYGGRHSPVAYGVLEKGRECR